MNNPNSDLNFSKDADITEVLGMDDKLKEMEANLTENMTEHMVNVNKKVQEVEFFLKNQYITKIYQIKQNTVADIIGIASAEHQQQWACSCSSSCS